MLPAWAAPASMVRRSGKKSSSASARSLPLKVAGVFAPWLARSDCRAPPYRKFWWLLTCNRITCATFTFSPDPDFEAKWLDLVGLYLNPPENALVLCVDEKPSLQALDRTQPLLPPSAKKPRAWTNEYVRHGPQTLRAALKVATGEVLAHVRQRRTSVNFLRFLDDVVAACPEVDLHLILDNLNVHKNQAAQEWLRRHPRVHCHYTPTHASWMNLIECFFSLLTRRGLQQSVHRSKQELKEYLERFIERYNQSCSPFVWTKGPEHLQKIIEATKEYQAAHPRPPRRSRKERATIV